MYELIKKYNMIIFCFISLIYSNILLFHRERMHKNNVVKYIIKYTAFMEIIFRPDIVLNLK